MEDNTKMPDYECAHKKVKNEARQAVIAKAERLAKEYAERKADGGEAVEVEAEEEAAEKEN